ncbi:5-carboxymethyl-2-hydroxymuconate Delta-isomerase [Kitasatospora sp. NPDC088346]|uniref:5-carboxymethyl-2-hydroxymuconate Delta-isomerase n=1 Tax=Kitasatospora sp. NPDC088346 TaxID=3364073 RepID=UPI003826C9D8
MPQIIVDHSERLGLDRRAFAAELHPLVAKTINAAVAECKTRFRRIEETYVGDGDAARDVVLLEIRILDGRTAEQRTALAEALLELLERHAVPAGGVELHLAVDVVEMDRRTYRKSVSAAG